MNGSLSKIVRNMVIVFLILVVVFGILVGSFAKRASKVMASETSSYETLLYETGLADASEVVIEDEEVPLASRSPGVSIIGLFVFLFLVGTGFYLKNVESKKIRHPKPRYRYSGF